MTLKFVGFVVLVCILAYKSLYLTYVFLNYLRNRVNSEKKSDREVS